MVKDTGRNPCHFNHAASRKYEGRFFYVRREVDLMKTAKVNAYIMHIFGKIELLSIHAALFFSKYITLMPSKRQIHTCISHTGNMVDM